MSAGLRNTVRRKHECVCVCVERIVQTDISLCLSSFLFYLKIAENCTTVLNTDLLKMHEWCTDSASTHSSRTKRISLSHIGRLVERHAKENSAIEP